MDGYKGYGRHVLSTRRIMLPVVGPRLDDHIRDVTCRRAHGLQHVLLGAGLRGMSEARGQGPAFQGGLVVAGADDGDVQRVGGVGGRRRGGTCEDEGGGEERAKGDHRVFVVDGWILGLVLGLRYRLFRYRR